MYTSDIDFQFLKFNMTILRAVTGVVKHSLKVKGFSSSRMDQTFSSDYIPLTGLTAITKACLLKCVTAHASWHACLLGPRNLNKLLKLQTHMHIFKNYGGKKCSLTLFQITACRPYLKEAFWGMLLISCFRNYYLKQKFFYWTCITLFPQLEREISGQLRGQCLLYHGKRSISVPKDTRKDLGSLCCRTGFVQCSLLG